MGVASMIESLMAEFFAQPNDGDGRALSESVA
jgi:hypothetical protein